MGYFYYRACQIAAKAMSWELEAGEAVVTLDLLPCSSVRIWQVLMLGGGSFKEMGSLFLH